LIERPRFRPVAHHRQQTGEKALRGGQIQADDRIAGIERHQALLHGEMLAAQAERAGQIPQLLLAVAYPGQRRHHLGLDVPVAGVGRGQQPLDPQTLAVREQGSRQIAFDIEDGPQVVVGLGQCVLPEPVSGLRRGSRLRQAELLLPGCQRAIQIALLEQHLADPVPALRLADTAHWKPRAPRDQAPGERVRFAERGQGQGKVSLRPPHLADLIDGFNPARHLLVGLLAVGGLAEIGQSVLADGIQEVQAVHTFELRPQVADHEADQSFRLLASPVGLAAGAIGLHGEPGNQGEQGDQHDERARHQAPAETLGAQPLRLVQNPAQPLHRLVRRRPAPRIEMFQILDEPRQIGVETGDRERRGPHHLNDDLVVRGLIGRRAGEQLVQQDSERIQIACHRHSAAHRLLRAHGVESAHDHAVARQRRGRTVPIVGGMELEQRPAAEQRLLQAVVQAGSFRLCRLAGSDRRGRLSQRAGDSEVEDLDLSRRSHHHIVRLEVAVDDLLAVRGGEREGDLFAETELAREARALAVRRQLAERLALDVFEDEKVRLGRLDEVVDLADGGVADFREQPCLAQEARLDALAHPLLGADRLDRHVALQAGIKPEIHLAHATAAEAGFDADMSDRRSDEAHRARLHRKTQKAGGR